MGFFHVERDGIFEPPLPTKKQPWYQRWLCWFLGHDWVAKEWAKTGYAILNPAFNPAHEMARLCTCNRCMTKKWIDKQCESPIMLSRYYNIYHPEKYPVDETGWPVAEDGSRLPVRPGTANLTGW